MDVHMSVEEKVPFMVEWWRAAQDLYVVSNLSKERIRHLVSESDMELKRGVQEFITELLRNETPILIFSAGLGTCCSTRILLLIDRTLSRRCDRILSRERNPVV